MFLFERIVTSLPQDKKEKNSGYHKISNTMDLLCRSFSFKIIRSENFSTWNQSRTEGNYFYNIVALYENAYGKNCLNTEIKSKDDRLIWRVFHNQCFMYLL